VAQLLPGAGRSTGMLGRLLAPLAAAASLAAAAPAAASSGYEVGVADDRLLFASDESAAAAVAEWRASGVDTVRIFARWGAHAPDPAGTAPPAGFDAADPGDPRYDWRGLDRAVGAVTGAGLRVVLGVTGWGPVWGSEFPVRRNPRWKPDPARFADYATAVARRYGALVDRYIVWNEPNVALWLQPQSQCSAGGRCTPYAPHHYRRIVAAAEPAIRAADPGAAIAIGALAPRGTSGTSQNANLRPLSFIRALGCVDGRYRRVRKGSCSGFRAPVADRFAYHPHGLRLAPAQRDPQRDQAHLADLGRLTTVLDRVQRAGGLRVRGAARFPLELDEYAYQTSPPDRILGVSRTAQAAYLQQSAYLAWRHPRVRSLVWYVWRDEPLAGGSGGWQSGLRFADGAAKPALAAFARPLWAQRRDRGTVTVWGQVRPGGSHPVTLERRTGSAWRTIATLTTDARGAFRRDVRASGAAAYRFRDAAGASAARSVR
jgi:hypothetical protein